MKKLIALLLAGIMLCCLAACSAANNNSSVDSQAADSGESAAEPPTVGADRKRSGFLRKEHDRYTPVSVLLCDGRDWLDMDLAFGYIDDDGEPVITRGSFWKGDMLEGYDPVDCFMLDPENTSTESCRVNGDYRDVKYLVGIFFRPDDDATDEFVASLPIIPSAGDSPFRFFVKDDNGFFSPIDYVTVSEGMTTLKIAYGKIENGNVELYDAKYWAKCTFTELNGFLTVVPTGTSTKECYVIVNTEKESNGHYLYCEPDNVPGVIRTSLAVIVDHST